MRLALYEPDIPQNTGTMIRLGACLGIPIDVIEPCGFPFSERALRRSGMDYVELADIRRHAGWRPFQLEQNRAGRRIVLLTTKAETAVNRFAFKADDVLMVGRESSGVPGEVHDMVDGRVRIPMIGAARSLNVAISAAIALGEAVRQCENDPQANAEETPA